MDDFSSLMTEELQRLEIKYTELAESKNIDQLALKILINALYGAIANKHFLLANPDLAAAITAAGRFFIRLLADNIEAKLQSMIESKEPYVVSGDTDSVLGDTVLRLDNVTCTIQELFDKTLSDIEVTKSGNEIKKVNGVKSMTFDGENTLYKDVKYVMRHKVKKRMFKITVDGKSVTVTEDHSLMVIRDGALISIKPLDIIKGDKLVVLDV